MNICIKQKKFYLIQNYKKITMCFYDSKKYFTTVHNEESITSFMYIHMYKYLDFFLEVFFVDGTYCTHTCQNQILIPYLSSNCLFM